MEESVKNGPSSAKKAKVEKEGNGSADENSHESGGFALSAEEEKNNDLFDQDTEPYVIESCESNENLFGGGDVGPTNKDADSSVRERAETPVVELEEKEERDSPSKVKKIESVLQDAKLITNIVDGIDVEMVYEKLKSRRGNPNRVDLVINEVLEDVEKMKKGRVGADLKEEAAFVEDLVKVIDKATANLSKLPMTAGEIQQMLKEHKARVDRVDYVVSQILVKHYKRSTNQKEEYIDDMMKVLSSVPSADPGKIYELIEKNCRDTDRVQKVIDHLQNNHGPSGSLRKESSLPTDPKYLEDPLYRDMRIVCKVLPEKEPTEIYEFLAAHHDKKNRLQVVIEELMKSGTDSQSFLESVDANSPSISDVMRIGTNGSLPKNIQEEVDELMEIFPDCDPNYLYDKLEEHTNDKERLKNIAMELFEYKNYPKLKDTLEERKRQAKHNQIQHLQFEMESFLVRFPDPMGTFSKADKEMTPSYKDHAMQQLRREYRQLKKSYITKVLETHNYHYHLSKREIEQDIVNITANSRKLRKQPLSEEECQLPREPDEFFYYEKLFSENEEEIKRYLHDKKQVYELRLQEARDNGELMECQCCFDEECLFEDMAACPEGHLFCKTCIRRSSEVVIGEGKTDFKCLNGSCSEKFSLAILQHVLPTNVFSIVLKKMQEEEIKMADIPDLVSCPFCSFATIMPDQNDKVFKCLNPDCLKESCRLCKEPNHVPLRCDEVEKQGETNMRTYIEARLTEAMIRRCHRCQKAFVKEFGCNKMTCTCGASSCYVCRAEDIDYNHFGDSNCNEGDMNKLHREEMLQAATEARDKYLQDHPEAAEINLKYDPLQHIEEFEGLQEGGDDGQDEEYDEEDDEDY